MRVVREVTRVDTMRVATRIVPIQATSPIGSIFATPGLISVTLRFKSGDEHFYFLPDEEEEP